MIVFLNGWGMDESVVSHLEFGNFDVLHVNNYQTFEKISFEKYSKNYLVAWSMGVLASNLLDFSYFDKKIALAGTNRMIDDDFGIPKRVYDLTVNHFSEKSAKRFLINMFQNEIPIQINISKSTSDLKDELIFFQNLKTDKETNFDKVFIPKQDKIVPFKNQMAYWQDKCEIEIINTSHYVFSNFKQWAQIVC
ncbi:DUF452 family protein [bacterium]|nr:DUF452 family protein [bacterium]